MSRGCYKKRLSDKLINELISDYKNEIPVKKLSEKYERTWTTLYGHILQRGIKPNRYRKIREVIKKKFYSQKIEGIDYNKIIRGKTLKEWQKYNTKINKKFAKGYDLL